MIRCAIAIGLVAASAATSGCGSHQGQTAGGSVHPPGWGGTPKGASLPLPYSAPSHEMFDTVTLVTVPSNPFALAGYTSGYWPTFLPLRRRYPRAHTISIAISASHHADCLDDEPGDASPGQAGPWARSDLQAGWAKPCVYTSLSQMPAVKASLRAWLGANWRSRVLLWLAWYRYRPGLVSGYDAVQWTDRSRNSNLDESTVTIGFLRYAHPAYVPVVHKPKPKPKPTPKPTHRSHSVRWKKLHYLIRIHCTPHAKHGFGHSCRVWRVEIRRAA